MAFKTTVTDSFTFEYPDNLEEGSLIIYFAGIFSADYARKDAIRDRTPENIKNHAFMMYVKREDYLSGIKNIIEEAKRRKPNNCTFNNIKVIGFSGGGENIGRMLSEPEFANIDMIGFADASFGTSGVSKYFKSNLDSFSGKSKIRMVYGLERWGGNNGPDIQAGQDVWHKIINSSGGRSIKDPKNTHIGFVDEFYKHFGKEYIGSYKFFDKPAQQEAPTPQTSNNRPIPTAANSAAASQQNTTGQAPKNITPNEIVPWFGEESIQSSLDSHVPILDSTTSVEGFLKLVSEEKIYKQNVIAGVEEFLGQIYAITETGGLAKYKVRVPILHSMLPIPEKYGDSADQKSKNIINLYPDFLPQNYSSNRFNVGDYVRITYENMKLYSGGKILNSLSDTSQGFASRQPSSVTQTNANNISDFKKNLSPSTAFTSSPKDIQNKEDKWVKDSLRAIKQEKRITTEIQEAILFASERIGIEQNIIKSFIAVESVFLQNAESRVGAKGLMQIMPNVSDKEVVGYRYKKSFLNNFSSVPYNVLDIRQNIFMGTLLLKDLYNIYSGDLQKMAGGYNYGIGRKYEGKPIFKQPNYMDILQILGVKETIAYISRITLMYEEFKKESSSAV